MSNYDDHTFDVDLGDFWVLITVTVVGNVLIVFLVCWLCIHSWKNRQNRGAVLATPVVITSTQHYPATGPSSVTTTTTVYAHPSANCSRTNYQQLQPQSNPSATAPRLTELCSQNPPSYEEAVGDGVRLQPANNPNYKS